MRGAGGLEVNKIIFSSYVNKIIFSYYYHILCDLCFISRGGVVNQDDLYDALLNGKIRVCT